MSSARLFLMESASRAHGFYSLFLDANDDVKLSKLHYLVLRFPLPLCVVVSPWSTWRCDRTMHVVD